MYAIGFGTVIQAHAIPLPKSVVLAYGLSVRAVDEGAEPVAGDRVHINRAPATTTLSAVQLPTAGFSLDREEANER